MFCWWNWEGDLIRWFLGRIYDFLADFGCAFWVIGGYGTGMHFDALLHELLVVLLCPSLVVSFRCACECYGWFAGSVPEDFCPYRSWSCLGASGCFVFLCSFFVRKKHAEPEQSFLSKVDVWGPWQRMMFNSQEGYGMIWLLKVYESMWYIFIIGFYYKHWKKVLLWYTVYIRLKVWSIL